MQHIQNLIMSTREKGFAGEGLAHYWNRVHKEEKPTRGA